MSAPLDALETPSSSQEERWRHVLLGLVRSERQIHRQLEAQRNVLHGLVEGLLELFVCCRDGALRGGSSLVYHSLQELLTRLGSDQARPAADEAEVGGSRVLEMVHRRIIDVDGLPPAHELVMGGLQPDAFASLVPLLLRWTHALSGALPACLVARSLDARTALDVPAEPDAPRFLCRATARVLEFWRLATSPTEDGQTGRVVAVLRYDRLRPMLRFLLVDLAEIHDVLLDEATRHREVHTSWPRLPSPLVEHGGDGGSERCPVEGLPPLLERMLAGMLSLPSVGGNSPMQVPTTDKGLRSAGLRYAPSWHDVGEENSCEVAMDGLVRVAEAADLVARQLHSCVPGL